MVNIAAAGHTQIELRSRVRVHVHNTLLNLVKGKRIGRELLWGVFLYVSADAARAVMQVTCRQQQQIVAPPAARDAGHPLVIEVLLEVIHGADLVSDPADIVARLVARGIEVTRDQVDGSGLDFPFDRPYLDLYNRCRKMLRAADAFLENPPEDKEVVAALKRLHRYLEPARGQPSPRTRCQA